MDAKANKPCRGDASHVEESTADYVEHHDLPTTLYSGLEALGCDVNDSYTPDDLFERTEKAFAKYPTHSGAISVTALWLLYENMCGCDFQKNQLRRMMSLCVHQLENVESEHSR